MVATCCWLPAAEQQRHKTHQACPSPASRASSSASRWLAALLPPLLPPLPAISASAMLVSARSVLRERVGHLGTGWWDEGGAEGGREGRRSHEQARRSQCTAGQRCSHLCHASIEMNKDTGRHICPAANSDKPHVQEPLTGCWRRGCAGRRRRAPRRQ